MNGHGPNRRADDPAIKKISDDLDTLAADYKQHVRRDDDTSIAAVVRKNMPVIFALVVQAIGLVWWFGGFVGEVKRNQEVTNLKLTYLERQVSDWYSKSDAVRDMALRDSVDADIKRRIDALENNNNARSR